MGRHDAPPEATPRLTMSALTVETDAHDRDEQLLAVAREVVHAWRGVETADVTVVSGGITNLLFKLSSPDAPPLLVRVFGRNTELVINRATEHELFLALSKIGFAPRYFGRFGGGRVEEFLEGFRPLKPHEMGHDHLRPLIAEKLREMHDIPLDDPRPRLWSTIRGWMETAMALRFEGRDAARHGALDLPRYRTLLDRLEAAWRDDWAALAETLGGRIALRAVLAHNDLLSGNILYAAMDGDPGPGEVRFIDYEYGGCSYAGFDIANHFCEYAGFDSDFERWFPPRHVRDDFVRHYLGPGHGPEDVADFSRVVELFVIPDHLFWGTWAVIQAKHSPIDFDYLEYARLRLEGCDLHRRELDVLPD